MAFNPFHSFRKHQKAVFAGLTIICMLTFVLASGVSGKGGDFFGELGNWFGARNHGNDVGKLYGHRIDAREMQILRLQRRSADSYIVKAILLAHRNLFEKVLDALSVAKDQKQRELENLYGSEAQAVQYAQAQPFFGDFFRQQFEPRFQQYQFRLQQAAGNTSESKNASDSTRINKLMADLDAARMQFDWLMQNPKDPLYEKDPTKPAQGFYFGGSMNLDGLVDFMIWRHQADDLGIQLTDEDVKKAIKDETLGYLTAEDDQIILRSMGRDFTNDPGSIRQALADEFRVRLAQATLVGYDPAGIGSIPAPVSPYELWEYYRRNRTEFSVEMLPIPVSKFVSQVKAKPSDADLKSLYEKYKDEEYAPDRESPGFKQPREIKVQWIDFSKDAQTYRTEARNLLLSQAAASVSNPMLGIALGAAFTQEYETAVRPRFEQPWGDPKISKLNESGFALDLYIYRDQQRPETLASTFGLAAGGNAFATAFSVPDRAYAREAGEMTPYVEQEVKKRALVAATVVADGCSVAPAFGAAGTWVAAGANEQYVPLPLMNRELVRRIEDKFAETLAKNGEANFKEGLEKVRKDSGRQKGKFEAAAAEYVKKQIETHKWPHGESKHLDDYYTVGQDEGLKPLKDAYLIRNPGTDPNAKQFGDQFFHNFVAGGKQEDTKPYTPKESAISISDKSFLFWITEDVPPRVLPFDLAKKKVEEAWYLKEARPLAEKAAEEIAQKAGKDGNPVRELVEAAKGQALISIDGIARKSTPKSMRADFRTTYQPYQFPADKLEYPRKDTLEQILDLKHVNDVTVLTNEPKDTYYVTAVTHRNEPLPGSEEFREGGLLSQLEEQRRLVYRRAVLERLRTEARMDIYPEGRKLVEEKGSAPLD